MRQARNAAVVAATAALLIVVAAEPVMAQLAADWMIPAAAHNAGSRNTFWRTDVSLHNPHAFDQVNNWATAELTYLLEKLAFLAGTVSILFLIALIAIADTVA